MRHSSRLRYAGVSAGAILAGRTCDTAYWKGWDDPTVVPEALEESLAAWQTCELTIQRILSVIPGTARDEMRHFSNMCRLL